MTVKSYQSITPLGDRILLKIVESEDSRHNHIIVIHAPREEDKLRDAIVLKIGDKVTHIAVNDKVLFGKWAGSSIFIDNAEYVIVKDSEIVAKVTE